MIDPPRLANAELLRMSKYGLEPVAVEDTEHFALMRQFWADPAGFVATALEDD